MHEADKLTAPLLVVLCCAAFAAPILCAEAAQAGACPAVDVAVTPAGADGPRDAAGAQATVSENSGEMRLQIRGAWLADLASDPPLPPAISGAAGQPSSEDDSNDRPLYRRAWVVIAAAGVAALAAGWISQRSDSESDGEIIPHLGFPPPPNKMSSGPLRRERWDR